MIIKGKIISVVRLNDIGKSLEFGKELSLNEYEVNRSKDLQNAISRGWVEIIYDRGLLKRAMSVQGQQQDQKITDNDIVDIAKKMAQSMAEEMIKNSPLVKEIAKEIAKEMVIGINENIKTQQIIVQQPEQKIDLKSSDNIFVDFKDDEVGMKEMSANIRQLGTVKEEKSDLSDSLEKMKKFRKQKEQS